MFHILHMTRTLYANPIDYLVTLIEHEEIVIKEPELWMPWNYTTQLQDEAKAA